MESQGENESSLRSRAVKAPGSFNTMPLNQISAFNNIYISPNLQTASINRENSKRTNLPILKNTDVFADKILIDSSPLKFLPVNVDEFYRALSISTTEDDTNGVEDTFYEASAVLSPPADPEIQDNKSLNRSFIEFEIRETIKFQHDEISCALVENEFATIIEENFSPTVEVKVPSMGQPLIANDSPLNLKLLTSSSNDIMLRKTAPFCNIINRETSVLLNILELEFQKIDNREDFDNEIKYSWLTRLRHSIFGYSHSEYLLSNPWSEFFVEEGTRSVDDEEEEEVEEEEEEEEEEVVEEE